MFSQIFSLILLFPGFLQLLSEYDYGSRIYSLFLARPFAVIGCGFRFFRHMAEETVILYGRSGEGEGAPIKKRSWGLPLVSLQLC